LMDEVRIRAAAERGPKKWDGPQSFFEGQWADRKRPGPPVPSPGRGSAAARGSPRMRGEGRAEALHRHA